MAKPSPPSDARPRLLVVELWGLGDLALAMPFLRTASAHAAVTLLAKPHAAPLLRRFAPGVMLLPFTAPWTAFSGKYRLHRWPWRELLALRRTLRASRFDLAVSARRDPRDHALLALAGARHRLGFPTAGSGVLLRYRLPPPARAHRAAHWAALAAALHWPLGPGLRAPLPPPAGAPAPSPVSHPIDDKPGWSAAHVSRAEGAAATRRSDRIVIHTGAGHAVRRWPRERFEEVARQLRAEGHEVTLLDDGLTDLDALLDTLAAADRFIGNDSGPGHLAALLGVPTFTIFGPQLPELFAPSHPRAAWIEGDPCQYKPCFDSCRFAAPHCLLGVGVDRVLPAVRAWLNAR